MDRQSIVRTVQITHEGQVHAASYFVEAGVIDAAIGGRVVICPLGNVPAAHTVRALLTGHVLQQARKTGQVKRWAAGWNETPHVNARYYKSGFAPVRHLQRP